MCSSYVFGCGVDGGRGGERTGWGGGGGWLVGGGGDEREEEGEMGVGEKLGVVVAWRVGWVGGAGGHSV